ncbi:MAG: hypothetical protein FWC28_03740 [Proteobacteria bacterium]|nr:hypothetical protein [Cystobacterineae bacterium]MCL2259405.1 hypothetical protein [Cystobacterineae bacterium]MCL2314351.1 hypothetical protein [Pseudomonadota bacterium]
MRRSLEWVCVWFFLLSACVEEPEADLKNPPKESFRILVSGEEMLAHGVAFPPQAGGGHSIFFIDGWEVSFESAIVTLANIQLAENPDMSFADPSMTGPVVAELEGVFAVELKGEGGFGLHGHEHALGLLLKQNKKKGSPAFKTQTRYAFGYSLVEARPEALQLGFSEASKESYARMQGEGWSVFIRGKARFKGRECRASGSYDFGRLPDEFEFELGFKMPVDYKNCLNPRLGDEVRGVQVKENASVDVVVTLHFEHLFWEALEEDAQLRLDAWAARKSLGLAAEATPLKNADLENVSIHEVRDAQGDKLPYRYCGSRQEGEKGVGLRYESHGVFINNLNEFIQYNLSTFGHLNEDGLCYPQRKYPSPL